VNQFDVIVIGGGAAGFFSAIQLKEINSKLSVGILEKTGKTLSKLRISGGGRCNVTHQPHLLDEYLKKYPRGEKELRQPFSRFNAQHTIDWFKGKNVTLKTEADGRMFPISNTSETIAGLFEDLVQQYGIQVELHCPVLDIAPNQGKFQLQTAKGVFISKKIIVAMGGHHQMQHYHWLSKFHSIVSPIPSLFTFNLPQEGITALQGISVETSIVTLPEIKKSFDGPLLITHWGLSGPAVIKLSAFASKELHALGYTTTVKVNWLGSMDLMDVKKQLLSMRINRSRGNIYNHCPFELPKRLWEFILTIAKVPVALNWSDISNKYLEAIFDQLTAMKFKMQGKTTFKEEFVTCGGVHLKEIDFKTMSSKQQGGIFFAGEILNIDGITGGFNFQAAWSTAFVAANSVVSELANIE